MTSDASVDGSGKESAEPSLAQLVGEKKTELVKLPSGSIDLVHTLGLVLLQFNASCQDALPYCHAQCCKMRHLYSVPLTDAEAKRLGAIVGADDRLYLPASSVMPTDCMYLEGESCSLHAEGAKPQACIEWHCSPGGNPGDPMIKIRAKGWALVPTLK